jgi:hypothetical protein
MPFGQRHWAAVGQRDREWLLIGIAPLVVAIGEDKTAASSLQAPRNAARVVRLSARALNVE